MRSFRGATLKSLNGSFFKLLLGAGLSSWIGLKRGTETVEVAEAGGEITSEMLFELRLRSAKARA